MRDGGGLGFDDTVGAFVRENHAALDPTGDGPLSGLTFAAKDVFHVAGHRTGFGNPVWLRTHPPADETAVAITRLLAAGARMVGRTLTDELAYSLSGENVHYGTPVNTNAPERIPGGSSNGSAAAVAAGLVDFALGTDCGGSVRLPASYCGILGIRPSRDLVPTGGVIPFGPPFDVVGWFARDPAVLERVGGVLLEDAAPPSPPTRLLRASDAFAWVDPPVADALAPAVARIAERVGPAEEVVVSADGLTEWFETFRVLQAASIWSNHGAWIEAERPEFGPGVKERFAWAAALEAEPVAKARIRYREILGHIDRLLGEGDLLVLPSSPRVAPLRDTPVDDIEIRYRNQAMHLLCIAGLGGLPQVSLPVAELDGLPLGLSIVGRHGSDPGLLALARDLLSGA